MKVQTRLEASPVNELPTPAADADDSELIEQLDQRRRELAVAAGMLRQPLRAVNRTDALIRRITPVLPYAIAAITVLGVTGRLLRGHRVRPALLIATGLDLWRLWKGINAAAATPMSAASPNTRRLHQENS